MSNEYTDAEILEEEILAAITKFESNTGISVIGFRRNCFYTYADIGHHPARIIGTKDYRVDYESRGRG